MAYTTDAALLQSVRDAIDGLLTGRHQQYTINMAGGFRSVTRLDLKELREYEKEIAARVRSASRGRFGVVSFRSPQR